MGRWVVNMDSSMILNAFIAGLISACSLPLGALTTLVWRPNDRVVAFLMAFGGGALLAALTIELVAEPLEKGHTAALIAGCVLGGLLFVGLNALISSKGGFLRKTSTTLHYLRRRRLKQTQAALKQIRRLDLFHDLPSDEIRILASILDEIHVPKKSTIYQEGDPADRLLIVRSGQVERLDPPRLGGGRHVFGPNDAFGVMAFLTHAPYTAETRAKTDLELWVLNRGDFEAALPKLDSLSDLLCSIITSDRARDYLSRRQGLSDGELETWMERAAGSFRDRCGVDSAVAPERNPEAAREALAASPQLPFLHQLPDEVLDQAGRDLFLISVPQGHTFFHAGEPADRLYIVESGRVTVINTQPPRRQADERTYNEAFGTYAFLTGARHSSTAVALSDARVWVWRKYDFNRLLYRHGRLREAVANYLQESDVGLYLEERQKFDSEAAGHWVREAVMALDADELLPPALELEKSLKEHDGAPLAIWLGILLDGIPESLVIGASMIHEQISLALIAGLFLSNYPESLSSSVGMRRQGMGFGKVFGMWGALTIITGIGAALGRIYFQEVPPVIHSFTGGVAAGSMLTMIAETMLPESFLKGGSNVGLFTLFGFLVAILFSTLQ
jgi:CRP-like cAMP-binding protein